MTTDGLSPHRGERVVDLRRLLAKTQGELAADTGITQANLSRIERGSLDLTDQSASRIARATGTPLEFFYYISPRYTADDINFRRKSRVSAKGREFVVQAFKEIERIAEMLAHAPTRLKRIDLPIAGQFDITNNSDIDAFAVEARRASGVSDDAPVRHVIRTLERAGIAVAPLSVPTGDSETLLDGHCGMSRWSAEQHRATVAFITGQPTDRQRFTVAHELGHALLHRHRDVPADEREDEANLFAGAFLLPTAVAARHVSESLTLHGYMKIKATFGISIQATITRGRRLNLISRERQRSLMIQISTRGWRKNEPVSVGKESPLLLWTELTAAHGPNPYFIASKEYGIAPRLLEQWVPAKNASPPRREGDVVRLVNRNRD